MTAVRRIGIPVEAGEVCPHFGHAPHFLVVDLEGENASERQLLENPGHTPGSIPKWLAGLGVHTVVAGGIGARAAELFAENGIELISGVSGPVDDVVRAFAQGKLESAGTLCTSHHHHEEGGSCGEAGGCHHD